MCGRYALFSPGQEIARWFGVVETPDLSPRFNIAPGQKVQGVLQRQSGGRVLTPLQWGFIPHWSVHPDRGPKSINARMETAREKSAFSDAFKHRRCLLPANGFYEWKTESGMKRPWYMESAMEPFLAFAGIWARWSDPQGDRTIESCAILTTESRGVTRQIHHRMPLLVAPEQFEGWLDGASEAPPDPTSFTWGHPISARPVSRIVNSPTVDEPACLNPDSGEGITEQLF